MKFKAVLTDQTCIKDFNNLIATFARLSKETILTIRDDSMTMLCESIPVQCVPLSWVKIGYAGFFASYTMAGVSSEFNAIMMSFNPNKLSSALTLLKGTVNFVKIKLTLKQFPCLTVIVEVPTASSSRQIEHDVPVEIIQTRSWPEYELPTLPQIEMAITMPTIKSLKSLCDKMKNLAPTISICCDLKGDLSFILETDSSVVASRYFNLQANKMSTDRNINDEISCRVDSKQLALCFNSSHFQQISTTGNIIQDELFNVAFDVRDNVVMHCLIYSVCD